MKINQSLLLLLLSSIFLMVISLYNGFPLVEMDTGSYIEQAIYPHFGADRTPFYALFVRITSLWTTLWFTVFAQCLLLAYLIIQFIAVLIPNKKNFRFNILCIISITLFTCVSWVSSYLMPDIFGGILLLSIILFLKTPQTNLKSLIIYGIIIWGSIAIHNSHFVITLAFGLLILLISVFNKNKYQFKQSLTLTGMSLIFWLFVCIVNFKKDRGFEFSNGSHVFMMSRLAESGVLGTYLADNCGKQNFKLCNYKYQIPVHAWEYMWNPESPFSKTGGWDSSSKEDKEIIYNIFTNPKYIKMFAIKSIIATLRELTEMQIPNKIGSLGVGTEPWRKVRQYFSDELNEYSSSMQFTNILDATIFNYIYNLFFVVSFIWVLWLYPKIINNEILKIYGIIIAFFIINAFIMSSCSTIIYRFQYRISWILPATNTILLLSYYYYHGKDYDVLE